MGLSLTKPAESSATIFRPEQQQVTLDGKTYNVVFDLNAFCELEKIYGSVDVVFRKMLGNPFVSNGTVRYKGELVQTDDITIGDRPLTGLLPKLLELESANMSDTLNILYAGLMHDIATYNSNDEITGYTLSKNKVGQLITLKNLKEINSAVTVALLRDMIPADDDGAAKNVVAPEAK